MLNYISILMLLVAVSASNGAGTPLPESDEIKIQRYNSIAMNKEKRLAIRISYADKLVKLNCLGAAAQIYKDILSDPRSDADLDWKLLAAEGLGLCGVAFKGQAILILMAIARNPNATDEQKASAKTILNEMQAVLK